MKIRLPSLLTIIDGLTLAFVVGLAVSFIYPRPLNNFSIVFYIIASLVMLGILLKNSKKFLSNSFKENYPGGLTAVKFFSPVENACISSSQFMLWASAFTLVVVGLFDTVKAYEIGFTYLIISFHLLLLTPAVAIINDSLLLIKNIRDSKKIIDSNTPKPRAGFVWTLAICIFIAGATLAIVNIQNFLLARTVAKGVAQFLANPL